MKFNSLAKNQDATLNHEGARAYKMTPEMELYSVVVTSTLSDNFYERGSEYVHRISHLVKKVDARFVAQLAVYTRTVMNLRSVPLLLVVELARVHRGDKHERTGILYVVLGSADGNLAVFQWLTQYL